jgi:flagellar basal body-associated protein FliL
VDHGRLEGGVQVLHAPRHVQRDLEHLPHRGAPALDVELVVERPALWVNDDTAPGVSACASAIVVAVIIGIGIISITTIIIIIIIIIISISIVVVVVVVVVVVITGTIIGIIIIGIPVARRGWSRLLAEAAQVASEHRARAPPNLHQLLHQQRARLGRVADHAHEVVVGQVAAQLHLVHVAVRDPLHALPKHLPGSTLPPAPIIMVNTATYRGAVGVKSAGIRWETATTATQQRAFLDSPPSPRPSAAARSP